MRAALSTLEVVRPRTLDRALAALADRDGAPPVPLAGGTDLFVYLNAGTLEAGRFLDLSLLRALRGVRAGKRGITIGATTTFTDIRRHPVLRRRHPSLVAAAAEIGAMQIQNRATLAGNIANASPAGDSLPALLAADARVRLVSVRGARVVPFDGFYTGYRRTVAAPDELIVAVELPAPPPRARSLFRKVGTRRAQSISKVVFAGTLAFDRRGRIDHVRLAWGSVAPTPVRAPGAEAALLGARAGADAARAALDALDRDIAPIDDIRSDRDYRRQVSRALLAQFLRAADRRFAR